MTDSKALTARNDSLGAQIAHIRRELDRHQSERRDFQWTAVVYHAYWRGQDLQLKALLDAYDSGHRLFLLDRPLGQITPETEEKYLPQISDLSRGTVEAHRQDPEGFAREHLWNATESYDYLSRLWNAQRRYPPGKVCPESFLIYNKPDAVFHGIVDPMTREIYIHKANQLGGLHPDVFEVQRLHYRKALQNAIDAADALDAKTAVLLMDESWQKHFQQQCSERGIKLTIVDVVAF
jgi:hypothetical protein